MELSSNIHQIHKQFFEYKVYHEAKVFVSSKVTTTAKDESLQGTMRYRPLGGEHSWFLPLRWYLSAFTLFLTFGSVDLFLRFLQEIRNEIKIYFMQGLSHVHIQAFGRHPLIHICRHTERYSTELVLYRNKDV